MTFAGTDAAWAAALEALEGLTVNEYRVRCQNCPYGVRKVGRIGAEAYAIKHALKHRTHRTEYILNNVVLKEYWYDQPTLDGEPPF